MRRIEKFQSLSGNSSVVGFQKIRRPVEGVHAVSIPFREFKCCRIYMSRWTFSNISLFQSLSGNSSVVGAVTAQTGTYWQLLFQSLSGNSSVVGKIHSAAGFHLRLRFNPFQGIQVLSAKGCHRRIDNRRKVSIPFREFKCCRQWNWQAILCLFWFQSLSGNSSVVGFVLIRG